MKKVTGFIVAVAFTLSVLLAVVNSATNSKYESSKNAYASICPIPPPPPPPRGGC